jgi:parallel beta-helix repeat protein
MRGFAPKALIGGLAVCMFFSTSGQALATHVQCGDVITQDTTLDATVSCEDTADQTAVTIGADNITLNLNGHAIRAGCSGLATAVVNEGHTGVTIENGRLRGYQGARLSGVTANLLRRVHANACVEGPAIELLGSQGNRIERSSATTYRGTGISLRDSDGNFAVQNTAAGNNVGIGLLDSNQNRVERNTVAINNHAGIALERSSGNRVGRNLAFRTGDHRCRCGRGLVLSGSDRNTLDGNSVFRNQLDGILVLDSYGSRLLDNVIFENGRFEGPADGLFVDAGSEGTTVKRNRANRNSDDGIDVESPATKLVANTANDNRDFGIEAVRGVKGGANKAAGNGNPAQCTGVRCK